MKKFGLFILVICFLSPCAFAAELPADLRGSLPQAAEETMEEMVFENEKDLFSGVARIWDMAKEEVLSSLREQFRPVATVLLMAILFGAAESAAQGDLSVKVLTMAGVLAVTAVTAGDMTALLGIGIEKIRELSRFSKVLLPTLSAAAAAGGAVGTASVHQVLTVFFADILLTVTESLLVPMVYLFIGVTAAEAVAREGRLQGLSGLIKKTLTWAMTVTLTLFCSYLAVGGAVAGGADRLTVKMTKMAVSGAVPVVGSIVSEAAVTALAGAGMLKNMIGIFGILSVLALCLAPFLQIAVQYLLYKATSFAAAMLGCDCLVKLIDGIGSAFGLVLGMVGSSAVLVMISILFSIMAVTV